MRRYRVPLLIVVLSSLLLSGNSKVAAAGAIRVSPAISNLQLQTAQASATVTTLVTNLTSEPLSIALSGRDFGALNQSGTVGFFGSSYDPSTNPHSLQNAIAFPADIVHLAPHASQKVIVNLEDLSSLAAGGHFGAVLFTPETELPGNNKPNVSVRSSVASLIFLTTANGGTQSLQLLTFHVGSVGFSLPSLTYVGFHNSGNTQSAVNGQLTLYGPNGGIVGTTVVNPGSGLVLPGTSRVFPVTLPLHRSVFAMSGAYRLQLQYRDGTQHAFTTVSERFYYINLAVIIPATLLLILVAYIGKRRGRWILKSCTRLFVWLVRKFRKKPEPVVITPKKRRPPLIQG